MQHKRNKLPVMRSVKLYLLPVRPWLCSQWFVRPVLQAYPQWIRMQHWRVQCLQYEQFHPVLSLQHGTWISSHKWEDKVSENWMHVKLSFVFEWRYLYSLLSQLLLDNRRLILLIFLSWHSWSLQQYWKLFVLQCIIYLTWGKIYLQCMLPRLHAIWRSKILYPSGMQCSKLRCLYAYRYWPRPMHPLQARLFPEYLPSMCYVHSCSSNRLMRWNL